MAKHVCIVGAGPSGIVAAKTLLYNAPAGTFKVTVFESSKRIGGLWPTSKDDGNGLVHPLMITNQSKHTMHFSDFAWEPEDPQFPRAWMVGQYLQRYLQRYPGADVKLNHRVVKTELTGDDNKWKVTVQKGEEAGGEEETSLFDYLLVGTGFFGQPVIPDFGQAEQPNIPVVHSSGYRDLEALLGGNVAAKSANKANAEAGAKKNILVVGGQMSGVEVAGTIANHLSSAVNSPGTPAFANADEYQIHHLIQRPSWVFPLFSSPKPGLTAAPFLPVDLSSYNLNNRPHPLVNTQGHIDVNAAERTHGIFQATLGTDQSKFDESIAVKSPDTSEPAYLAMSENYAEFVRSGLIKVSKGKLSALEGSTATTSPSDEKVDNVAAVILATGFDAAHCVSFLPDSVKATLDFKPEHRDLPLALGFHGTMHRDLPTLGFVGFYRSPYWGVMEMQARFLAALWTPSSVASSPPALAAALADETDENRTKSLRDDPRCSQFPMGDYPFIMQELSATLGIPIIPPPEPQTPSLPHNDMPMNILTPSRYLSPFADDQAKAENKKALQQTNEAALAGLTSSKFVAHAVFRSLLGTWKLERSLKSKLPTHPNGHFSGTARFLLRDATTDGLQCVSKDDGSSSQSTFTAEGDPGMEYLYIEEGQFHADNGLVFQATRRYVWRYDEGKDVISVWFARTDDDKRADYLFHEIEFPAPEDAESGETKSGWKAKAGHLCIDDFYNVAYEFSFKAVSLEQWKIGYTVKGPKKDYTIQGTYTR